VAAACHAEQAYSLRYVKDEADLYHYSYKIVSERFQYFLQDTSRVVGEKQHGIIIADHRGTKQDNLLRKHHHDLIDTENANLSSYENFIETVFLTPSHLSIGIQLADMAAGAIGRHFNAADDTWFNAIRPSIRSSPTGKIEGYGIAKFPGSGW
jgi:hypothetical protein